MKILKTIHKKIALFIFLIVAISTLGVQAHTDMDLDKLTVDRTVLPLKEAASPVIKTRIQYGGIRKVAYDRSLQRDADWTVRQLAQLHGLRIFSRTKPPMSASIVN